MSTMTEGCTLLEWTCFYFPNAHFVALQTLLLMMLILCRNKCSVALGVSAYIIRHDYMLYCSTVYVMLSIHRITGVASKN
jgi:hypothetical protein